ncbi:MAG: CCA tRNA nucleotidyltransferase [Xenococcaceae cyanobacterium MO_188.B29]|nr:CCA tRNA nucleotidyltransferase [Xenococcaceae cyanobacterium MO_188.B29]
MSFETTRNYLSCLGGHSLAPDRDESFLCFQDLPFSLDLLPSSAYLVGGAVRDALLQRKGAYLDLDFVLPENAIEIAEKIARQYHWGFVVLDEQRQIARVVFSEGTVDFARQEGDSLEKDLQRRDFTINAIAYNIHRQKLLDPLGGLPDLQKGLIRMVSVANLKDDPLRLLRAYRQAAQLNFTIEPETRQTICSLSHLIDRVAAERVQTELKYLFANPQGSQWLIAAGEDGLLKPWFSELNQAKFQQLKQIKAIANSLAQTYNNSLFNQPDCLSFAHLASLVSPSPEQAELELLKLKYSRTQLRTVLGVVKYLPQLQALNTELTLREQYFFFLATKEFFPILVIRAIVTGVNQKILAPLIENYLNPDNKIAHPQPLITGKELLATLNLKPAPIIGKLLTEIQIAQGEGKITTTEEALKFASHLLETKSPDNQQPITNN